MSLIAILTDTHYGARKNSKEFHSYFNEFYQNVFFPTLEEYDVKTVLHLGDVFDNRRVIDYQSLEWSKTNIFDKLVNYDVHMLTGNHDCYYKNTNKLNSLQLLLDSYSNISVYDNVAVVDIHGELITLIPWINSENEKDVMDFLNTTTSRVVMGHLEINGFEAHPGHIFEGGLDKDIFSKFKRVFSGHFHHKSKMDNIHYLGNTYEITWSDYGEERGFHLYDTQTGRLKFIQNPYRMFKKFYYDDIIHEYINPDLSEYKNSYVKVIVENKTNLYTFDKLIETFYNTGVHDLKIIENIHVISDEDDSETISHEDTLSTLQRYIDDIDDNYDKSSLKSLIKSIYIEASDSQ